MKSIFKKIALLSALVISVVCLGLFAAACGEDSADAYTITLVYENGKAVNGKTDGANGKTITFQLCFADGSGCLATTAEVDENGKASISVADVKDTTATYHVQLNNVPANYGGSNDDLGILETDINVSKPGSYKITLKAKS